MAKRWLHVERKQMLRHCPALEWGVGGTGLQLRTEEVTGVKGTVWKM